jgi:hypothetical protein
LLGVSLTLLQIGALHITTPRFALDAVVIISSKILIHLTHTGYGVCTLLLRGKYFRIAASVIIDDVSQV